MLSESKLQMLAKQVELFEGLNTSDVGKIFAHGLTMNVRKGDTLFYKGTVGDQMYVVLVGKIGIYDGKEHLASLGPGDMFGEMALVTDEPRSANAIAQEDSHLYMLNETTFKKLLTKRVAVQILLNIIKSLSHRIKQTNAHLKRAMEVVENHDLSNEL